MAESNVLIHWHLECPNRSCRRKESFKKCPNERDLVNWARVIHEKPVWFDWQNQSKLWSSYHLPLLVKEIHLPHFPGNFYNRKKSSEWPTTREKRKKKNKEYNKKKEVKFFSHSKLCWNFLCAPTETKISICVLALERKGHLPLSCNLPPLWSENGISGFKLLFFSKTLGVNGLIHLFK